MGHLADVEERDGELTGVLSHAKRLSKHDGIDGPDPARLRQTSYVSFSQDELSLHFQPIY